MFERQKNGYVIPELNVLDRRLREAAGIAAPAADEPRPHLRRRMFAPRRMVLAGLVCVAIAMIVAFAGFLRGGDDGPLTVQNALAGIAATAVDVSNAPVTPEQYLRTRSRNIFGVTTVKRDGKVTQVFEGSERDDWISLDRAGLIDERRWRLDSVDDSSIEPGMEHSDGKRYVMSVAPDGEVSVGYETLAEPELADFPVDPQLAYARIKSHLGGRNSGGEAGTMWQALTESLYSRAAWYPPALRAALVNAIGLIPGVKALEFVSDPVGRPATAFALESAGVRHEIYFDPETAVLVATRDVAIGPVNGMPDVQSGDLLGEHIVIAAEVVDEVPERYSERLK